LDGEGFEVSIGVSELTFAVGGESDAAGLRP
jgi:hypothetical protein